MNRYRLAMMLTTITIALCGILLQPDNLTVWGNAKLAGLILLCIQVVASVIDKTLPSWNPPPQEGDGGWMSAPKPPRG